MRGIVFSVIWFEELIRYDLLFQSRSNLLWGATTCASSKNKNILSKNSNSCSQQIFQQDFDNFTASSSIFYATNFKVRSYSHYEMNSLTSRLVLIESVRDCFAIAGKCLPSQQTDNVQIERSRVLNQDTKGDIKKTLKFAHFNEVSVTKDREKRGNGNRFNFAFARKLPLFLKENILHTVFLLPEMLLIKLCSHQKFIVGLLNLIFFNFQIKKDSKLITILLYKCVYENDECLRIYHWL